MSDPQPRPPAGATSAAGAARASAPRRRPGRELAIAVGLAVVGAAIVLLAASRPWVAGAAASIPEPVNSTLPGQPLGGTTGATGRAVAPVVWALGLVALAGALALLATRRRGRYVVGGLLVLTAAGIVAGSLLGWSPPAPDPAIVPARHLPLPTRSAWPFVGAFGGLPVAAAGVLALVRGARWPGMGARYDSPAGPRGSARRPSAGSAADLWRALDHGDDPTAPPDARRVAAARSPEDGADRPE